MSKYPWMAAFAVSILLTEVTGSAAQTSAPDLPLAFYCFSEKAHKSYVVYLREIQEDGSGTYSSLSARASIIMTADGIVQPPTDRSVDVDCFNMSLDEMRAAGRVVEFKNSQ